MTYEPLKQLASKIYALPRRDVDTDQIIPARFLTTTSRNGLAEAAFYDWRFDSTGNARDDDPFKNANIAESLILVAGDNFGCGSSREHAPWALQEFGFRVVISTKIADIFRSNALKNGLLTIEVSDDVHAALIDQHGKDVMIDLEAQEIRYGNHVVGFEIDPFARSCLIDGTDTMSVLLSALPEVEAFEEAKQR